LPDVRGTMMDTRSQTPWAIDTRGTGKDNAAARDSLREDVSA